MKASPQQQFDCMWSKGFSGMLVSTEQPSSMRASAPRRIRIGVKYFLIVVPTVMCLDSNPR